MANTETKTRTATVTEQESMEELAAALSKKNLGDLYNYLDNLLLDGTATSPDTFPERLAALSEKDRGDLRGELYAILIGQAVERGPSEDPPAKKGKENIAVLAWHSIGSLKLDMIDTAHIALSQLDIHGDPEGAKAVIECVQSYLLDIRGYLDDHLEDLKAAFNALYPLAKVWPGKTEEINIRVEQ